MNKKTVPPIPEILNPLEELDEEQPVSSPCEPAMSPTAYASKEQIQLRQSNRKNTSKFSDKALPSSSCISPSQLFTSSGQPTSLFYTVSQSNK